MAKNAFIRLRQERQYSPGGNLFKPVAGARTRRTRHDELVAGSQLRLFQRDLQVHWSDFSVLLASELVDALPRRPATKVLRKVPKVLDLDTYRLHVDFGRLRARALGACLNGECSIA